MASSRGMAVLISLVRLASSFSLPATGKVPTFFGCSKFCSDDRRRSSHEFADLAHPGRCISYAVFCLKKKRRVDAHPLRRLEARRRRTDAALGSVVRAGVCLLPRRLSHRPVPL